jgi:diguanylate cyclase
LGGDRPLLDVAHNPWLVLASIAVAMMAGFTGLSLTHGASARPVGQRKAVLAMSAVALGGGIWSMHFVAMLGMQLPYPFYYDALVTLLSALIAILMAGVALLLLHFRQRTPRVIVAAGAVLGVGIAAMHFVGMLGMEVCRPVNGIGDYVLSTIAAVALSILAIWVAYDRRTRRNILFGTVCFGMAVVTMHFFAILQTGFVLTPGGAAAAGPLLGNQALAMGVAVSAFLICAAFLLTGVTFFGGPEAQPVPALAGAGPSVLTVEEPVVEAPPAAAPGIPYEKDGRTLFAGRATIAAIRAEGHYTLLYTNGARLFCPWSITEAAARLEGSGFVRVHRSYLVNPSHVSSFERLKDTGALYFAEVDPRLKVPVSRSRLGAVREALGV